MDDLWLDHAIVWAAEQVDGIPDIARARTEVQSREWATKARASLALARESYNTEHRRSAARWQLANACRTFSNEAQQRGDLQSQREWLAVACLLFADLSATDPKYEPSLNWCASQLRALGVEDWHQADPIVINGAAPPAVAVPLAPRGVDTSVSSPPDLEADPDEIVVEPPAPDEPHTSSWEPHTPPAARSVGIDPDAGHDHDLERLIASWHGPLVLRDVLAAFDAHVIEVLGDWPILVDGLRPVLTQDFAEIEQRLGGAGLAMVGDDVLARAREARSLASAHGVTPRTESFVRQRWLVAGAVNFALLTELEWATNRAQVMLDILGYVTAIQIARRFSDADRELLLASHEFLVQAGSRLPRAFHRFPFVRSWITSAFGTYLLLAGPQPTIPSESLTDDRILGERRTPTAPDRGTYEPGREERSRWAQRLLSHWRFDKHLQPSAAFSVASVSGWDPHVIDRLMMMVFPGSGGEDEDERAYWHDHAASIISRAKPIRVASNPWAPGGRLIGASSLVTSDDAGRLFVPDAVLKAMVSQITEPDWSITVQGAIFRGRRVPTYLLMNQYGPFGVLKLDFADRVKREKENFERYARKRLRAQHRPSECQAGDYQLYVRDEEEPLQAILTSYVFDEDEAPTTLAEWLRQAAPDDIPTFLDAHLAGRVMNPWLSHVRRDVIDLRMAYPLLRPRPGENEEHAPRQWAKTELAKLQLKEVRDTLGLALHWGARDFADEVAHLAQVSGVRAVEDCVNPLWFIAQLAELTEPGAEHVLNRIYNPPQPLSAFNTLLCINHGDLHADNLLCTGLDRQMPAPVLIDFETTHETHLCRDFARLEASVLCQVFAWRPDQAQRILDWLTASLTNREAMYEPSVPEVEDDDLQRALNAACRLRRIVESCRPTRWNVEIEEYGLALLAAFTPMARYTNAMSREQRAFGLLLAAIVATRMDAHLHTAPAA